MDIKLDNYSQEEIFELLDWWEGEMLDKELDLREVTDPHKKIVTLEKADDVGILLKGIAKLVSKTPEEEKDQVISLHCINNEFSMEY